MGSMWKLMILVAIFAILMSPTDARFSKSVSMAQQTLHKTSIVDVLKIMRKFNIIVNNILETSGDDINELFFMTLRFMEPYVKPMILEARNYFNNMMDSEDQ